MGGEVGAGADAEDGAEAGRLVDASVTWADMVAGSGVAADGPRAGARRAAFEKRNWREW